MKKTIFLALSLATTFIFAQQKFVYGDAFEYNSKYEKDIKLVLCDDYNQYVFSDINEDGFSSYPHKKIILRKLDQKGNLIDTYIKDYANKTNGVIHNYLGSIEVGKDKMVVFTEEIENRSNRKEIFQHIFNKKDGTFSTTSIAKLFVESGLKQGTTYVRFSENKKYVAIINDRSVSKKTANTIDNIVIDLSTLSKKWEKEITLDTDFMEADASVTNSGRVLILRKATGWKEASKLVYVSAQGEQDVPLQDKLILKTLNPISINDQDYLISFGYFTGVRVNQSDFGDMAFINLQNNNVVMSKISEFRSNTNMSDVETSLVQTENGKTNVYGYPVMKTMPASTPTNRFPDPVISYGPGYWFTISSDGTATNVPATTFGKVGYFVKDRTDYFFANQYELIPYKIGSTSTDRNNYISLQYGSEGANRSGSAILTSIQYLPESDRILFLRKIGDNKLDVKSIYNFNAK